MRRAALLVSLAAVALSGCMPAWVRPRPAVARPQAEAAPVPPAPAAPGMPAKAILALSGGGSYGAYTAGILTGWSRSNARPKFDVVTGVSTGSLIAPLAFLGPEYDGLMRRFYTEVGRADVLAPRYWAEVPFSASTATAKPLRDILELGFTPEAIQAIRAEHQAGRRLYVATTQLDTRRPVVWDLGAVAGGPGGRELLIDVLLASCAVPGVFPPVRLPGTNGPEWHVDGGVTAPVFVPPEVLETAAPDAELFVVIAGKYYPDVQRVRPHLLSVLAASGGAVMHAHTRREVANLYHQARLNDVAFHAVSLRQDYPVRDSGIEFDTASMGRMFVEGVRVGLAGPKWDDAPAERSPGSGVDPIRTGPGG